MTYPSLPTNTGITDHTELTSIGTNTHAQIDTHITEGPYQKKYLTLNDQTGTTYTLVLTDADTKWLTMANAAANTLTVPPNSSVAFPIGTQINVNQKDAGQTTIVQGAGVTINTPATLLLRAQWSSITLVKVATDVWTIMGDLEAV